MRKLKSIFFKLFILVTMAGSLSSCGYNSMVSKEEAVNAAWSQVENVYQRRSDLIPNLVNTVKGVANFEQKTLTDVIQARASATQVKIEAKDLTPENVQKFQAAQGGLTSALSRLMVSVEKYPELKANQNFTQLMDELAGTENRITIERQRFNQAVQEYNSYIRSFPNNMTAGMFGFKTKGYFQADAGAKTVPKVDFNTEPAK